MTGKTKNILKIDGRRFSLRDTTSGKDEARHTAEYYRERGWYARVLLVPNIFIANRKHYGVYLSPRGKK